RTHPTVWRKLRLQLRCSQPTRPARSRDLSFAQQDWATSAENAAQGEIVFPVWKTPSECSLGTKEKNFSPRWTARSEVSGSAGPSYPYPTCG
ncbi:hypothetical protein CSUI_005948, partial [Cystoisospora suis]